MRFFIRFARCKALIALRDSKAMLKFLDEKSGVDFEVVDAEILVNQKNMEERLKDVLNLICDNPCISRTAMAAELDLTEAQIKTAINTLKSREIIYHEGPAKGGKWVVK